ncbi:MAG: outer membrane protein transport protein [Cytophagaceae bacterium]|jgi:hypothetical protein|nr:outer membrane protein transport protein [Cytophagaceae bacterium]
MKRIIIATTLMATGLVALAQTEDDALRFSVDRFSGTARSVALSGAVGALGGDYTSIGVNPAGIAVYRSSEFTFTPSFNYNTSSTNYYKTKGNDDKFYVPLQQIGYVGTFMPMRDATNGIVSSHFSIGYNKTNNFSRRSFFQAEGLSTSMLDTYVLGVSGDNFYDPYYNWATGSNLIFSSEAAGTYLNAFEYLDKNNKIIRTNVGIDQSRVLHERGGAGDFNIAAGANVSNKLMFGGSFAVSHSSYRSELQHAEAVSGGVRQYPQAYREYHGDAGALDNYIMNEELEVTGIGVNLKVGVIYKPVNSVRIGAAFHSPTFYSFDESYATSGVAEYYYDGKMLIGNSERERGENSYNFRTPFKGVGSLAYIFDRKGLVSVDYEYTDYSAMQFVSQYSNVSDKQWANDLNKTIRSTFRPTHNLRFGAEFKPTEVFTLRGGYGLIQNPYQSKYLNSSNKYQTFSFGIGYRANAMFIDAAYMLRNEKYIYSLYYDANVAEITNNNHQLAVTLGWRF